MRSGAVRSSLYALACIAFISGCSGSGGGGGTTVPVTGGTLQLSAIVYDDNKSAAVEDDRLDIYFSAPIDAASLPADIASAFDITGTGVIAADSLYSYSYSWPYRLRIKLGALSTPFVPGSTQMALAPNVITDANLEYPAYYPLKSVSASRTMLKTAQSISYAAGDDGAYQSGTPRAYERNATSGIVKDLSTGLSWLDHGATADALWSDAALACAGETAGNYFDWRLPGMEELTQLSEKNVSTPAIDAVFQNIAVGSYVYYWSDMPLVYDTSKAWAYSFDLDGYDGDAAKSTTQKVMCVRGERVPRGEYLRNDLNGTVLDASTGLLWQDNLLSTEKTWDNALAYCEGLVLSGYFDWRLPNYTELSQLADRSAVRPAIDVAFDVNRVHAQSAEEIYWSSTSSQGTTTMAFGVTFDSGDGRADWKTTTAKRYARCVRNMP